MPGLFDPSPHSSFERDWVVMKTSQRAMKGDKKAGFWRNVTAAGITNGNWAIPYLASKDATKPDHQVDSNSDAEIADGNRSESYPTSQASTRPGVQFNVNSNAGIVDDSWSIPHATSEVSARLDQIAKTKKDFGTRKRWTLATVPWFWWAGLLFFFYLDLAIFLYLFLAVFTMYGPY